MFQEVGSCRKKYFFSRLNALKKVELAKVDLEFTSRVGVKVS
jgi:hypothetical protein